MEIIYTADASEVSMVTPDCPSRESSEEPEQLPPLSLRFSVFFDGTGNNMFNTRTRLDQNRAPDDSYRNDFSNIAKLANYIDCRCSSHHFHIPVYVEGMGTQHGANDDINGMAFGSGERGIVSRVGNAIRQISYEIRRLSRDYNRTVDVLKIDSFGFSRGAASARHFIYRISNGPDNLMHLLRVNRITVNSLLIPFVGLYDSVASFRSYGPASDIDDDTHELFLDRMNEAQKVFHVVAGDEFRLNFPLTDISSTGARGTTMVIPGAHSDVGGGYNNISSDGMTERQLPVLRLPFQIKDGWGVIGPIQRRFVAEMNRLIRQGWYHEEEFVRHPDYRPGQPDSLLSFNPLIVNRSNIRNTYPRIPLKIMVQESASAGLNFLPVLDSENPLTGNLAAAQGYLMANRGRSAQDWNSDPTPLMRSLRHDYFHTSAHYRTTRGMGTDWPVYAMRPQFYSSAHEWNDNDENILAGEKRRRVYSG